MFPIRPNTFISGGQTGVDRAALDFAIANGIDHAGWCPAGRIAADGVLDVRYQLIETDSAGYRQRTKRNVESSDATLIIYKGALEGGSRLTMRFAEKQRKPYLLVNLDTPATLLLSEWQAWWVTHKAARLNVAGPSEARCPGIYDQTLELLDLLLAHVNGDEKIKPLTLIPISNQSHRVPERNQRSFVTMKVTEKKVVEAISSVLCDSCGCNTLVEGTPQFATLRAHWGFGSAHDGERYELELCEGCFFGTLAYIKQERRVNHMFDNNYKPDEDSRLGLVATDDYFGDGGSVK